MLSDDDEGLIQDEEGQGIKVQSMTREEGVFVCVWRSKGWSGTKGVTSGQESSVPESSSS